MSNDLSAVPIKGRVARFIQLDVCGNPISGTSDECQIITKGFISITAEPQYEDGEQHRQRLADGSLCVNDDDPDDFTEVNLTIMLCGVCPSISKVVASARLLQDGGAVSGTGAAYGEDQNLKHFSLEVWQNVTGRGACDASGAQRYVYWAFPNVRNGRVGTLTIENAGLTMELSAKTDAVGGLWGNGPGTLGPWFSGNFAEGEHYLWNITTTAPPTIPPNCGCNTIT